MQISKDKEDITIHEPIALRVRNILHDALAEDDANLIPFISTITPILEHPFFFELYFNILLTKDLPMSLKETIVSKMLFLLQKYPELYLREHYLAVEVFFIASKTAPELS